MRNEQMKLQGNPYPSQWESKALGDVTVRNVGEGIHEAGMKAVQTLCWVHLFFLLFFCPFLQHWCWTSPELGCFSAVKRWTNCLEKVLQPLSHWWGATMASPRPLPMSSPLWHHVISHLKYFCWRSINQVYLITSSCASLFSTLPVYFGLILIWQIRTQGKLWCFVVRLRLYLDQILFF